VEDREVHATSPPVQDVHPSSGALIAAGERGWGVGRRSGGLSGEVEVLVWWMVLQAAGVGFGWRGVGFD